MLDRTVIRSDTVDRLKGATAAGDGVLASARPAPQTLTRPAVLVSIVSETMNRIGGTVPQFRHDLILAIDCIVDAVEPEPTDRSLDALCFEVLDRLLGDADWCRRVGDIRSVETLFPVSDATDPDFAIARISIGLSYLTAWTPRIAATLEHVAHGVDAIDPADPNRAPAGGPDGRLEIGADLSLTE